jgi:hypothetical protein
MLSRSHHLTVGAPGRGDRELFVQRNGSSPRDLFGDDTTDIFKVTCSLPHSNLIARPWSLFCRRRDEIVFRRPPSQRSSMAFIMSGCIYMHPGSTWSENQGRPQALHAHVGFVSTMCTSSRLNRTPSWLRGQGSQLSFSFSNLFFFIPIYY